MRSPFSRRSKLTKAKQVKPMSKAAGGKSVGNGTPGDLADKFKHFKGIVQAKQNFIFWSLQLVLELTNL